jgi:DNA-binding IclR family transcriptional regulator
MLTKANAVLSLFSLDRPELGAAEAARLLKRPRSTAYRILGAMAEQGFLDVDPVSGRYRVGIRLAMLGEVARASTSLQRVAHDVLLDLSRETSEMSTLMVLSGTEGVTIDVVESYHPIKIPAHLGGRFPLHAAAGGKVLLAWQPEERIEQVIRGPLARLTPATITSPSALRKELDAVRRAGYATAVREWIQEVLAVAAPVRDHRGAVIAALAVASVPTRWKPAHVKKMVKATVAAAGRLSRAMGYHPAVSANGGFTR